MYMTGGEAQEDTIEHQGIESSTPKTHVKYLLSLRYKYVVEYISTLRFPPNYDKAEYHKAKVSKVYHGKWVTLLETPGRDPTIVFKRARSGPSDGLIP